MRWDTALNRQLVDTEQSEEKEDDPGVVLNG